VGTTARPQMPEILRGFLDQINPGGTAQGLGGLTQGAMARAEPLPEGARFLAGSFGSAAGSRGYKLYIPSTYRGEAVPLCQGSCPAPRDDLSFSEGRDGGMRWPTRRSAARRC